MLFVLRTMIIPLASIAAGLFTAAWHKLPLFPDKTRIAEKRTCAQQARAEAGIELPAFQEHFSNGFLVIDARPAEEFAKGHLAAPDVLNVPPGQLHAGMDSLSGREGEPIVLYCTSLTCDMAEELYCEMQRAGFMNLRIYFPGWQDGILKHNLPATGDAALTDPETSQTGSNESRGLNGE